MKVHQILWQKEKDHLIFRETSCFICLDMNCKRTKFVGKLCYKDKDESTHVTNKDNEDNNMYKPQTNEYEFSYKVSDYDSGSDFGHAENRQDDKAERTYLIVLPDGTKQGQIPQSTTLSTNKK
ncbi:unnamed protein product [Parnassius apollo]|uniref:(apollo) hypothetical protein n=1 Tax=Parnassius apollo TaxID=110799 RepID=A0A8S3WI17_PARAO|nr:unnamed protein product [Parnassius apollo]